GADRIGIAAGVRVYPETGLERLLDRKDGDDGYIGGDSLLDPLFYIEPGVAPFLFELLDSLIGDDRRFLFFDPSRPDRNYNYNANEVLVAAIGRGLRGAYWDILRRCEAD
ncbi:MAG: B12-binding domain-containing radical SAM protein, partial [bacterium]